MAELLQTSVQNHLLAALSRNDFSRIKLHLHEVKLHVHDVLLQAGDPISFAYFIESGVASLVVTDHKDDGLDIALVGREGMSGVALILDQTRSLHHTYVQMGGSALRISAATLKVAMEDTPTLRLSLLPFAYHLFTQVSRSALACGRYKVVQRLARWLLLCHDRLDGDAIPLTHSYISLMLGIHRPGVTTALHELEEMRGILSRRGLVEVRDRSKLEAAAGGCYGPLDQHSSGC